MGARKLSALKPTMDANGVNMVAIGLEQLGAQDFVNGNFFDGGVCVYITHVHVHLPAMGIFYP